jgi:hypothetical protein
MSKMTSRRTALAIVLTCIGWSGVAAQSRGLDACSVLTRDEIKSVSPDPGELDPGGNSDPEQVTTCYWRNQPKGSVSLWPKVSPAEPKGLALKQLLDKGRKARAVPGLGDDAVFMENPDGSAGGTLFVRVSHWRIVISREADHPTATAESVLSSLTSLARIAIPKLKKAG